MHRQMYLSRQACEVSATAVLISHETTTQTGKPLAQGHTTHPLQLGMEPDLYSEGEGNGGQTHGEGQGRRFGEALGP